LGCVHIRVSLGSAILLGLRKGRMDAVPTTLYIMLGESCGSSCLYCSQAVEAEPSDSLSRVTWPPFPLDGFIGALARMDGGVRRVCVQTLDYPGMADDLVMLSSAIRSVSELPVSASVPPLSRDALRSLRDAGVSSVGISVDVACGDLFDAVRQVRTDLQSHWTSLEDAIGVFGCSALHLIAGLGETDLELLEAASRAVGLGADVALFAYTPLDDRLPFTRPVLERYRALQAGVMTLRNGSPLESLGFDGCGRLTGLPDGADDAEAFRTSGCPGCNRPYYNESPAGPMYNHPAELTFEEAWKACGDVRSYGVSIDGNEVSE